MDKLTNKEQDEFISMINIKDYDNGIMMFSIGIIYLKEYPEDFHFKTRLFNKLKDHSFQNKIRFNLKINKRKRWR